MNIKSLVILATSLFALASCGFLPEESIPSFTIESSEPTLSHDFNLHLILDPSTNTYVVTGLVVDHEEDLGLEIPSSYEGVAITGIDTEAFLDCATLALVEIPSSITWIGSSAFSGCTKLATATFLEASGWSAGSTSLSSADLSDSSIAATYLKDTYAMESWSRS